MKLLFHRGAMILGLAILLQALPARLNAQTLTRGPYLQNGSSSAVSVRWRTSAATDSVVRYGTVSTNLDQEATSETLTTEHEIRLIGLDANTKYFYSVGSTSATLATGDDYFVVTAPTAAKPTRIWVLGDPGTGNASQLAVRNAYYAFAGPRHTDLWLMLGDNAYTSGSDGEYQNEFFNVYPAMLRKSVVWLTLGNHDGVTASSASQTGPYYDIFTHPRNAEAGGVPSGTEAYYSFNYGNIHFVSLNSQDVDRAGDGVMANWLREDLANNTKDWLIAFFHHPPYSRGSHDSDEDLELIEMRQNIVPILEDNGVDVILSGHSHSYERSKLLDGHYGMSATFSEGMVKNGGSGREDETGAYAKSVVGPSPHEGTVYAVAGASGQISGGALDHPAMFISLNVLGSMVLDFDGSRLDAKYLDSLGVVQDYFSVVKGPPGNVPPAVNIASPANGASFVQPVDIAVHAAVSDSDGTVAQVDFFDGATLIGSAAASPFSITWANAPTGTHNLTARATDNLGASSGSSAVTISVAAQNILPVVNITTPTNNTVLVQPPSVAIAATATDGDGSIVRVDFYDNTTLLGSDTSNPYSYTWNNPPIGGHSLIAVATDNRAGTNASSPRSLTINPNSPPTASLTAPTNGVTFVQPLTLTVRANAADSDGNVARVDFYDGATLIGSDTSSPYSFAWANVPAGGHSLTGVAVDNRGATGASAAVSITVNPNTPPTANLTSPANGASYVQGVTINFAATAADTDGTVSRVSFYDGAALLGFDTSSPYTFAWSTASLGNHMVTAVATDNGGATNSSSAVSITVNPNSLPTVTLTGPANGASFPQGAGITLTANATDTDGTIARVSFYDGSTLINFDTSFSYAIVWGNAALGPHTVTAVATDNANATNASSSITINVVANNPPTANMTSPANGAGFAQGGSITLNATAADGDGSVSRVSFYDGATLLGFDTSSPYSFVWVNPTLGAHSVTAVATDSSGGTGSSTAITVNVNANAAPTANITSPANGAAFPQGSSITVNATAADSDGTIARVSFYDGATLLGTDTSNPYSYVWTGASVGTHNVTAVATDNSGATGSSSIVAINVGANNPPTANITSPTNNATFVQPVNIAINATAFDSDGTIARVSFYDGATLLGSDTSNPYSFSWSNVPLGPHSVTAVSTDNSGATGSSSVVMFNVNTNVPPSVSITNPVDGASFMQPVNLVISANASDSDGTVTRVDFYANGTLLGGDTSNPYSFTWTNAPIGTFNLTAIATDNRGATRVSSAVSVTIVVNNLTYVTLQDGVDGYTGMVDTHLRSDSVAANMATATNLEIDGVPDYVALLRWDLAAIPPGKVVSSVTMTFNVSNTSVTPYEFYALKQPWIATEANWNRAGVGLNWQVPGADGANDRETTVLGSIAPGSSGTKVVTLNGDGIAKVQAWIDNPASNFGFILLNAANSDGMAVTSSEGPTISLRPKITVAYLQ